MDVRCERCRAQYVFDDDQVTPSGLTVQCTNCGHLFKVKKKELVVTVAVKPGDFEGEPLPATAAAPRSGGARASLPGGAPAAAAPQHEPERAREWRVRQANGNIFTFRELTTLQKWIIEQKVARDDEISLAGDQWKRLGNIADLASFFQVVEAAERSRAQPALTPLPTQGMPAITPMPMPLYGVGSQTPSFYPPPPPSGFPPPSYAAPPPPPSEYRTPEPTPALPPPVHEVDLGPDVERPAAPHRGGARTWLVSLLLAAVAAGAAYLVVPGLLAKPSPPSEREVAVPLTIEMKAAEPPAPPPPVPAPEPVVEAGVQGPPEPVKPAERPAPKGPKALLAQARKLLEKGDPDAALELFGRVASQDPRNAEALTGRGLCYLDLEKYAPAEASFSAALQSDPGDPDAMLGLAETYRFQGKQIEAIAHYEKYLARHPDGEEAEVARNALAELRK
ncbi:MAG TPA: tetratricopeptide repeat protein [Anaeromyxobacter sp.]